MPRQTGLSRHTLRRLWGANGPKSTPLRSPHRVSIKSVYQNPRMFRARCDDSCCKIAIAQVDRQSIRAIAWLQQPHQDLFSGRILCSMRGAIFAVLLLSATAGHPQSNRADANLPPWKQAQIFRSEGFQPVFCFTGQVKVAGKRLSRHPYSLFTPDEEMRCCGTLLKSARTDRHGHFLVEPMPQGRYFVKFESGGSEELVSFAVVPGYERCDGSTHLEINFSKTGKVTILSHIDINDSGEDCLENEPHCYRK
jgi:hypothetical protein